MQFCTGAAYEAMRKPDENQLSHARKDKACGDRYAPELDFFEALRVNPIGGIT